MEKGLVNRNGEKVILLRSVKTCPRCENVTTKEVCDCGYNLSMRGVVIFQFLPREFNPCPKCDELMPRGQRFCEVCGFDMFAGTYM